MTKIRTGGSLMRPVSIPLSQWSNQRKRVADRSILAVGAEVDFTELGRLRSDVVRPGAHDELLRSADVFGCRVGDHAGEVQWRADLLIVVPAREVQDRHADAVELVLIALAAPTNRRAERARTFHASRAEAGRRLRPW